VNASTPTPALPPPRPPHPGGGRIFSHFTSADGVTGTTGIVGERLFVGQQVMSPNFVSDKEQTHSWQKFNHAKFQSLGSVEKRL